MGFFDALSSGLRAAGRFVGDVVTSPEFGALVAPIAQAGVQRIASEIFQSPNSGRPRTGAIALPPGIAGQIGSGTLINRPPTIFTPPAGDAGLGLPFAGISVGGPGGLRIGVDTPQRSTEPAPRSTEVSMALPTLPGGAPVGGMSLARGGDALFQVSAAGRATPRKLVMSLTPAGNPTYWRHVGKPIAFSGDRGLCKRMKKVGRQLSAGGR